MLLAISFTIPQIVFPTISSAQTDSLRGEYDNSVTSNLSLHREQLRVFLPETTSPILNSILKSPDTILYTSSFPSDSIPPAYQITNNPLNGLHSPFYNISADFNERQFGVGNPNKEFPWFKPGGTDLAASSIKSIKFFQLPRDSEGKTLPIIYYSQYLRTNSPFGETSPTTVWLYPVGTVFGEVLLFTPPNPPYNRYSYAFELRLRKKTFTTWEIQVWKPFPTLQHLIRAIGQIPRNLISLPIKIFRNRHPRLILNVTTQKLELPSIPPETTHKLLTETKFEEATNQEFYSDPSSTFNGQLPSGPTNETSDFHIIPRNYEGHFIGSDVNSCTNCHDSVLKQADFFDLGRDWYGRVRGSDGIFSFHIFDNNSISYSGSPKTIRLNQELLKNRLLVHYNRQIHSNQVYFWHKEYRP